MKPCLNIYLKSGSTYGGTSILASYLDGEPAITFISSGHPTTVKIVDVEKVTLSTEDWCPFCQ